jgi:hypothetical protein
MSKTKTLSVMAVVLLVITMALILNTILFKQASASLSSPTTNATTTISNLTSATPIYQQHSQFGNSKVIGVTSGSTTFEANYSGSGFAKGISVTDQGTVLYTVHSTGAIYQGTVLYTVNGTGKGLIRSADGETVTYTFKAGGQLDKMRNIAIQGTLNFNSIPTGNLAFLSNVKGILKGDVTNRGQLTFQVWQQK